MTKIGAQNWKDVGEFFKKYRERANLTRDEVASYLGVEDSRISAYEDGNVPIPFDAVFTLSNLLSIDPDDVVRLFYDLSLAKVTSTHPPSVDAKLKEG